MIDLEHRQALVDGRVYGLYALSKTAWRVIDLETGQTSSFGLRAASTGSWIVGETEGEQALAVAAAWIWGCRQVSKSPLPPRPPLH